MKKLLLCAFALSVVFVWARPSGAEDNKTVFMFDMGHPKSLVWEGFIGVGVNSLYTNDLGYGWVEETVASRGEGGEVLVNRMQKDSEWQKLAAKSNKSVHPIYPDALMGDYVFWRGGNKPLAFRVKVVPGKYRIWVYSGMFDASRMFDCGSFKIGVNGKIAIEENITRQKFIDRLFENDGDEAEWRPGQDMWQKYVKNCVTRQYCFTADTTDGILNIEFYMPPTQGIAVLPINAIMVCAEDKAAEMEKTIKAIEEKRRLSWQEQCKLVPSETKDGSYSPEYVAKGYVPFTHSLGRYVFPDSVPAPDEIGQRLAVSLAQGQRAVATFSIHPLVDLKGVEISVSDLKSKTGQIMPKDSIRIRWVRYLEQPVEYRRAQLDYRPAPVVLKEYKPLDIPKNFNRQYVLAVTAPEKTEGGVYSGTVTIKPANSPASEIPVELTVYPFVLEDYDDDDERYWIYYPPGQLYDAYGDLFLSPDAKWKWVEKDFALMKEYEIAPTIGDQSYLKWTLNDYEKNLDIYKKFNFRGYVMFRGAELGSMIDAYKPGKTNDYDPLVKRFRELLDLSESKGLKPLFYMMAEIHTGEESYQEAKRAIGYIKSKIPNLKACVLTMGDRETEVLTTSAADVVGLNAVTLKPENISMVKKAGKKVWQYAWGRNRFRCGLIDWRCGVRGGLKEWFAFIVQRPFNPFDGLMHDGSNDSPPLFDRGGSLPTLNMEETTAGRIDFLYLATMDRWLERAKAKADKSKTCTDEIKKTEALIAELQERIESSFFYYYERMKEANWTKDIFNAQAAFEFIFKFKNKEYEEYRAKIAERIIGLKNACR